MVNCKKKAGLLVAGLSYLSVGESADSLNIDLEVAENVDLGILGDEGLAVHRGKFNITVDEECKYLMSIVFKPDPSDNMRTDANRNNFQGECDKVAGADLHKYNRHWLQFKDYVYDTTGFNHMSLYPRPCGLEPKGRRQPRYDVNFYTVPAHYRAMWVCQTFDIPEKCGYQQPNFLGRGHFTVPRLYNNKELVPNSPRNFQPDINSPEAHAYEGLLMSDQAKIPQDYDDFNNPEFDISTYDGDFASFRALIPHQFINNPQLSKFYWGQPVYEYQTLPGLPTLWNVTWDAQSRDIRVYLKGDAQLCDTEFEDAKTAQEVR